jgi:hypothetical protein
MDILKLSDTPVMFDYEHVSSENLAYMPMIVRFHLDAAGLRMSLAQWQLLPLPDRELLTRFPVSDDATVEKYFSEAVTGMLDMHADAEPEPIELEAQPAWRSTTDVPGALIEACKQTGLPAVSLARWAGLLPLQRYVLVKLTRKTVPSHDFVPAMQEFGLAGA